ncbi:MAG: DUF1592 domain-containing protein [Planctomycetes bacterium]|nr:DUF1592 domain-containing protein [Planctomycetota bacterium]
MTDLPTSAPRQTGSLLPRGGWNGARLPAGVAILAAIWLGLYAPLVGSEGDEATRKLLSTNCLPCHSALKHKGDLDLEKPLAASDLGAGDEHLWENIRRVVSEQEMPPPEKKQQPSLAERDRLITWIDRTLDGPGGDTPSDPGSVTIHRLTHVEYNRTIHDLLGVDGDPAQAFPPDSAGGAGAFDNQADTLFVSPLLMERLLGLSLGLVAKAEPARLGVVEAEKNKQGQVTPQARRKAVEASLTAFLPRAWRRPVTAGEVQALYRVYERAARGNVAPQDALQLAYAAALTSTEFLFRFEEVKSVPGAYPLGAYELANRLSYFLWSTMPDEALLAAAKSGALATPEGIAAQVTRMLADPRARILASQFMGQWLGTADLATGLGPDAKLFEGYSDALRAAMIAEPAEFLQALLDGNGSVLDLIDCAYVYADETLARHYRLTPGAGAGFTRIAVDDGRRGGLVTMAGVLAVTSRPSRTSPVLRGKWILQELLSYPPPPPPANVPALIEATAATPNVGTLRQRLERHRADPACASCHQRIDPLGFGLENFDALGRWRTQGDQGEALDAVGTLPNGETFSGPQQLKKLLMQHRERIMTTLVERLLAYALGRGPQRCDRPSVRLILTHLAADGWKARTLVTEIALSLPFRAKRNPLIKPAAPSAPLTAK